MDEILQSEPNSKFQIPNSDLQSTKQLINYLLYLADSTLILAQQNGDWCGHGPILEQDIAITNITLDMLGQARNYYQFAADLMNEEAAGGGTTTEDSLAYLRTEREYKNLLLCEQENGDWAMTIARQFFFSSFQFYLAEKLSSSPNERLAGIAAKSLKEITYHVTWSAEWMIRLGDGTAESKARAQKAVDTLWTYTGEMFKPADYELAMVQAGVAPDPASLLPAWTEKVSSVLDEATLTMPASGFMQSGGKTGVHSEQLGFILTDLQYLQRTYPNAEW